MRIILQTDPIKTHLHRRKMLQQPINSFYNCVTFRHSVYDYLHKIITRKETCHQIIMVKSTLEAIIKELRHVLIVLVINSAMTICETEYFIKLALTT